MVLLLLTGAAQGNIASLFKEGYTSIGKIAVFLAVISAIYPSVGYIRKKAETESSISSGQDRIESIMKNFGYSTESFTDGKLTFRQKNRMSRISRMLEDRITMTDTEGGILIEGLRKDVIRIASAVEYRVR